VFGQQELQKIMVIVFVNGELSFLCFRVLSNFGAALDPDFGGVVFWVVREIAKVVKKEVILGDSWSSSESDWFTKK
jgi:hypothetical protein